MDIVQTNTCMDVNCGNNRLAIIIRKTNDKSI